MRKSELVGVLLFLAVMGVVYLAAARICVVWVYRRIRRRKAKYSKARLWRRRVVMALAVGGILAMAYGRFIEPWWPEVTHVRLVSDKLPPGSRPIRIAHISDLHCDAQARLEEALPSLIAAERPDAIVFTGDAVNSIAGAGVFIKCMTDLAKIAPVFAVSGNWGRGRAFIDQLYADTPVTVLHSEAATLTVGEATVQIIGVPAFGGDFAAALGAVNYDRFTLLLHHYGDAAREIPLDGVDLFCAGHTHGGQVAMPLYGPLVSLTRYGDARGLYRIGDTTLYVNRGIGMEGGHAPRVRFLSRPEITIYELHPLK